MKFSKMHGLGNDFVVIDGIRQTLDLSPEHIRHIADRRYGIGCDQVLLAEAPTRPGMDVRYRIFNADGTQAEHCGNGVRCLAVFLQREGLVQTDRPVIETGNRVSVVEILSDGQVRVDMGEPRFEPSSVPISTEHCRWFEPPRYEVLIGETAVVFAGASMGNPHAIVDVDSVSTAPVASLGPTLGRHPAFPEGINIGFMEIVDPAHIRLRVYERGCGETSACGTGACAAVATGRLLGRLAPSVSVELTGGHLQIDWDGPNSALTMVGSATHVFDGVWP